MYKILFMFMSHRLTTSILLLSLYLLFTARQQKISANFNYCYSLKAETNCYKEFYLVFYTHVIFVVVVIVSSVTIRYADTLTLLSIFFSISIHCLYFLLFFLCTHCHRYCCCYYYSDRLQQMYLVEKKYQYRSLR